MQDPRKEPGFKIEHRVSSICPLDRLILFLNELAAGKQVLDRLGGSNIQWSDVGAYFFSRWIICQYGLIYNILVNIFRCPVPGQLLRAEEVID